MSNCVVEDDTKSSAFRAVSSYAAAALAISRQTLIRHRILIRIEQRRRPVRNILPHLDLVWSEKNWLMSLPLVAPDWPAVARAIWRN